MPDDISLDTIQDGLIRVERDGELVSEHQREDKAISSGYRAKGLAPASEVRIVRPDLRVEGDVTCPEVATEEPVDEEPTPEPDPEPTPTEGAFYATDFSEFEIGQEVTDAGANGFRWGGAHDAVYVSDDLGFPALKAEYGPVNPLTGEADHWWAEQNFDLGRDLTELWIDMELYHLDGTEGLGAAWERHEGQPTKMITTWSPDGDGYNDGFHTYEYWGDGSGASHLLANMSWPPISRRPGGGIAFPPILGQRTRFRTHYRWASGPEAGDGISQAWVGDELVNDHQGTNHYPINAASPLYRHGYVFGYDNEHFPEATAVYLTRIAFYDSDPGWQ